MPSSLPFSKWLTLVVVALLIITLVQAAPVPPPSPAKRGASPARAPVKKAAPPPAGAKGAVPRAPVRQGSLPAASGKKGLPAAAGKKPGAPVAGVSTTSGKRGIGPSKPAGGSPLPPVPANELHSYKPFTYYASAAYCPLASLKTWTCKDCKSASPSFKVIAADGDGGAIQRWFVGYDTTLKTIIVSHQGTDPGQWEAVKTDLKIPKTTLDAKIFPGLSKGMEVHKGFAASHAKSFPGIKAALTKALAESKFNSVTIVGHSLGGALALLDGVALPLHFPKVNFKTITYGQPRVGNLAFAIWVNTKVQLTRITNKDDVVTIIPGRKLGFVHASGEKHIQADGSWVNCVGIDNTDPRCATGDVSNVFKGSIADHSGPYDGVMIGCR